METTDRDPDRARAAAVLRRSALAVPAGRVDELADLNWDEAIDQMLDPALVTEQAGAEIPETDEWQELLFWWMDRMTAADTGIVDRMTFFWHGHLTTNARKVEDSSLIRNQMSLLRTSALGNFRDLLQKFVVDGALLRYLDGDGSEAYNPNENLGRELMELFTLGRGNYEQDDVRAAARALAGWRVIEEDNQPPTVEFRREAAFVAPLLFLGDQADWTTESIIDRLCDDPRTASRVSSKIWADLVGTELDAGSADDLGRWWQDHDLEIAPLVERILRSEPAQQTRFARPRTGLEWFTAAKVAVGFTFDDPWHLDALGQMPFLPPSVAGWARGDHWLGAGSLLERAGAMYRIDFEPVLDAARSTDDVLTATGIEEVSEPTLAAFAEVDANPDLDADQASLLRWRLALNTPEFHLL